MMQAASSTDSRDSRKKKDVLPVPTGVLSLEEEDTILFKFNFGKFAMVPRDIIEVIRQPDYRMDVLHQMEVYRAKLGKLAKVGRVREGRVDTGECVIEARRPIQVATRRRGLANNDFRLVGLHRFRRKKEQEFGDDTNTYVVCACFARVEHGIELTNEQTQALRELAGLTWNQCYVWKNPEGHPATINCVGPVKNQQPKWGLVIRDGAVKVIEVARNLEENEE